MHPKTLELVSGIEPLTYAIRIQRSRKYTLLKKVPLKPRLDPNTNNHWGLPGGRLHERRILPACRHRIALVIDLEITKLVESDRLLLTEKMKDVNEKSGRKPPIVR